MTDIDDIWDDEEDNENVRSMMRRPRIADDYVHPLSINGQLMKKDARIAELEAALKPFAEMVVKPFDDLGGISKITVGDLRAASAAYRGEKDG